MRWIVVKGAAAPGKEFTKMSDGRPPVDSGAFCGLRRCSVLDANRQEMVAAAVGFHALDPCKSVSKLGFRGYVGCKQQCVRLGTRKIGCGLQRDSPEALSSVRKPGVTGVAARFFRRSAEENPFDPPTLSRPEAGRLFLCRRCVFATARPLRRDVRGRLVRRLPPSIRLSPASCRGKPLAERISLRPGLARLPAAVCA
jgi:hypothetical protein